MMMIIMIDLDCRSGLSHGNHIPTCTAVDEIRWKIADDARSKAGKSRSFCMPGRHAQSSKFLNHELYRDQSKELFS